MYLYILVQKFIRWKQKGFPTIGIMNNKSSYLFGQSYSIFCVMESKVRSLLDEILAAVGDDIIKQDIAMAALQTLHYQLTGKIPNQFSANFFSSRSTKHFAHQQNHPPTYKSDETTE